MRYWKKFSLTVAAALTCALIAPAALPAAQPVTAEAAAKVKLNKTKLSIEAGKTASLKVNGTKKAVKWASSNKSVATVTQKGKVKGIKAGKAKITATVAKKKYTCTVTVNSRVNPAVKNAPFEAKEETVNGLTFVLPKDYKGKVAQTDNSYTTMIYYPGTYKESELPAAITVTIAKTGTPAAGFDELKASLDPIIDGNVEGLKTRGAVIPIYEKDSYDSSLGKALVYDITYEMSGQKGREKTYVIAIDDYMIQVQMAQDLSMDTELEPDIFEVQTYLLNSIQKAK